MAGPDEEKRAGLAKVFGPMKSLCWASFGILCGHIWIWEVVHRTDEQLPGLLQGTLIYLALSAFMILCMVVAICARPAQRRFAVLDWPMSAVLFAGTLLLCLPAELPLPLAARIVLGSILGGCGMAWSYLQWSFYYGSLGTRAIIACIFGAMALGSLIKIPLDLVNPMLCCIVCSLLGVASTVLVRMATKDLERQRSIATGAALAGAAGASPAGASPAGSAGAAVAADPDSLALDGLDDLAGIDLDDEHGGVRAADSREAWRAFASMARPVARVFAGVIAYGLVIGMMQGMTIVADPMPKWILSTIHHLLEAAAAFVVVWYVLGNRGGLHFGEIWTVVLLSTGAGVMLLPIAGPAFSGWALIAVAVAQTLVVMLLWAMLADVAHRHRASVNPVAVFGAGWTVYSLSFPIGRAIGDALGVTGAQSAALVGLIVYVLAVSTVLFLRERDFSQNRIFAELDAKPLPPSMNDVIGGACKRIGSEHGLTDRETEVMRLICLGRSKAYIAESLSISENTVRSHARHLYSKLGAHSKQDLLDMVQELASKHPIASE